MSLDRHVPLAPGPVSGRPYVRYTGVPQNRTTPPDYFTTFSIYPYQVVADASSFPSGVMLDASVSNVTEVIASGLGYTTAYNPITGTRGFQRPTEPTFLSTAVSPSFS